MTRDPKQDPQPGDVFTRGNSKRPRRREVLHVSFSMVTFLNHSNGHEQWAWRDTWDAWVRSPRTTVQVRA